MKIKQKPSGIWMVEFDGPDGARRRVSTGVKTAVTRSRKPPAEYAERINAKAREIVLGIATPDPRGTPRSRTAATRLTMNTLWDRCERTVWHRSEIKSEATIRSNLKILRPLIGEEAPADVNYSRIERLIEDLKGRGYAPGTIKRKMDMVSKALRMATIWTDDSGRPLLAARPTLPSIRVDNMKDRIISRVEETAVFNAIEKRRQDEPGRQWFRFHALITFLADTGGRLGESRGIGPTSVTVEGQPFEIGGAYDGTEQASVTFARYQTKSDKPRRIPLTGRAWRALLSLRPHMSVDKEGCWLFFPITASTVWYMWDTIREDVKTAAGFDLSEATLHTWRHTCLTRLAQGGMDILRLKLWAGHSDIKITAERYTHLAPDDLMGGMDILNRPSNGANAFIPAPNNKIEGTAPAPVH